ncbi:MAG: hypothetical protein AABZ60_20635 [Planctomycetota bacterium]
MSKNQSFRYILWILLSVFVGYAPMLANHFTLDDAILLTAPYPQTFSDVIYLFSEPVPHQLLLHYRPLTFLSFVADHYFWGDNPIGFHVTNLCLAALSAVTAFVLLQSLLSLKEAFLSVLLFSLCPASSEAIFSIYNRSQILGSLGLFLSVIFWHYALKKNTCSWAWMLGSAGTLFLGCLAKENAFVTPLICLLWTWVCPASPNRRKMIWFGFLFQGMACIAYLYLRYRIVGAIGFQKVDSFLPAEASILTRYINMCWIFTQYVQLLFFPVSLSCDYPLQPVFFHGAAFVCPLLFLFFGTLLIRRNFVGKKAGFGGFWFLIHLLPALHGIPIQIPFAERLLYPAALGGMILLALGFQKISKRMSSFFLFFLIFGNLGILWTRCLDWKTEDRLWEKTLQQYPSSYRAWIYFGTQAMLKKNWTLAFDCYHRAGALNPNRQNRILLLHNLAHLYLQLNQKKRARSFFSQVLELEPYHRPTCWALGDLAAQERQWNSAIFWYEKVVFPVNRWDRESLLIQQRIHFCEQSKQ